MLKAHTVLRLRSAPILNEAWQVAAELARKEHKALSSWVVSHVPDADRQQRLPPRSAKRRVEMTADKAETAFVQPERHDVVHCHTKYSFEHRRIGIHRPGSEGAGGYTAATQTLLKCRCRSKGLLLDQVRSQKPLESTLF